MISMKYELSEDLAGEGGGNSPGGDTVSETWGEGYLSVFRRSGYWVRGGGGKYMLRGWVLFV